jgi:hypothetical protein
MTKVLFQKKVLVSPGAQGGHYSAIKNVCGWHDAANPIMPADVRVRIGT